MSETYKSKVYTDRPAYADFDAPAKFEAIKKHYRTAIKRASKRYLFLLRRKRQRHYAAPH